MLFSLKTWWRQLTCPHDYTRTPSTMMRMCRHCNKIIWLDGL